MKKEIKEFYICDYCGAFHEDKNQMELHENICPKNPKNQPCSTCQNLILGMGCAKNINMDVVDNKKVKCFFYKEGLPQTLFTMTIDGDHP